jgi:protein-disulfide isomerase
LKLTISIFFTNRFLVATSFAFVTSVTASAQSLFTLGEKTYELKDVSPAHQQQLFDVQYDSYERTRQTIDGILLETFLDEEAKKQNKPKEEVASKTLEVKEPTDKEVKKWYDDNKSRIPPNYQFDQIKGEIVKLVKQEKMKTKRDEVLEKIKKDRKFSLSLAKPLAPMMAVQTDGFQSKGKDGAKVHIVEFADYQCPHCKSAAEVLKKVMDKMKSKVKFTFVDYPINPSGVSKAVAEASQCAAELGKFWEFHYKAFESQASLEATSGDKIAKDLKLDEAKMKACTESGRGKAIVAKGLAEGERLGVTGTPFIIMNGRRYVGAQTVEAITAEIEAQLK